MRFSFVILVALFAVGASQDAMEGGYDIWSRLGLLGALAFLLVVVVPSSLIQRSIEVEHGKLTIRSGRSVAKSIDVSKVTRVYAVRRNAPASNLRRPAWWIEFGHERTCAYPEDASGFFEELARQAPHLHRYGSELRSTAIMQEA